MTFEATIGSTTATLDPGANRVEILTTDGTPPDPPGSALGRPAPARPGPGTAYDVPDVRLLDGHHRLTYGALRRRCDDAVDGLGGAVWGMGGPYRVLRSRGNGSTP